MRQMPRPFHDSSIDTPTRRQVLTSAGAFAGGGLAVSTLGSGRTKAAVSATQLQIPDEGHRGKDGSVSSLSLQCAGSYEYAAPEVDELAIALDVAPDGDQPDYQTVDQITEPAGANSGAGQYSLAGSILDHSALDSAGFSADAASTTQRDVRVRVLLDVRHGGETVASGVAETVVGISVENTSVQASAAVTGSGEVAIQV